MPLLVIAAGGTAGHMFPAQSLAEVMLAQGWRVKLSTDARGARYTGGFPDAVEIEVVPSATFARGGVFAKLAVLPRIMAGVLGARRAFRTDRPAAVVGFGGYPAIPAMAAAVLMGLPRMIHEQNGVLGRVNQLFARRVQVVACGTWPTALPPGVKGLHVGNPIRATVVAKVGAPFPDMSGRLRLLVFGGSQGATVMTIVPKAVALLPEALRARLDVFQQARDADAAEVTQAYEALSVPATVTPFFADMPEQLEQAHLVVCRSGASSVADICAVGRPAIYVPLASAIRDEQTANAGGPLDADAALIAPERDLSAASLAAQIEAILSDPAKAAHMASKAKELGRPNAAEELAGLVVKLSAHISQVIE